MTAPWRRRLRRIQPADTNLSERSHVRVLGVPAPFDWALDPDYSDEVTG